MFILINGSFGIGKTSVAGCLNKMLPGAAIFDPEKIGYVLRRLPWVSVQDYQNMGSWRLLTATGALSSRISNRIVIIPMTFTDLRYLTELRARLSLFGAPVHHFCLIAPLSVVRDRLSRRGENYEDPKYRWVHTRAEECCRIHASIAFKQHISTEKMSIESVAQIIYDEVENLRLT